MAALVYFRAKDRPAAKPFAAMTACASIWCSFPTLVSFSSNSNTIITLARLAYVPAGFTIASFIHLAFAISSDRRHLLRKRALLCAYVLAVFFAAATISNDYIRGVVRYAPYFSIVPGNIFHLLVAFYVIGCSFALVVTFQNVKRVDRTKRNQLSYFLIASAILATSPALHFGACYLGFEPFPHDFIVPIFMLMMGYAIMKHQLLDIRIAIRRTVIYSVLATLITGVYFGLLLVIERFLQGVMGYRSAIGSLIAGFTIAICFNPLKEFVQQVVDRLFFHGTQLALAEENERLRQEIGRTERLKSVATLAAGMAHEIKNPLAAIKTFAEYMPDKFADPAYREKYSKIMGQEVEKMNALVQRLLEFARPGAPRLQRVEPAALLRETLEFLQGTLVEKQVQVDLALTSHAAVQGDPGQLKQVFLNLLLNSIDAIEPPGRLMVSAHQENGHVRVTITDTGCGIAKADLPRIFDPFFTRKSGGTGLGLSVVHSIVQEHGGRINVDSVLGIGTTIHISLPTYGGSHGATAHPDR